MGLGQSAGGGFRGRGGKAIRSKMNFSILNGFGELSFTIFLAYYFHLESIEKCL